MWQNIVKNIIHFELEMHTYSMSKESSERVKVECKLAVLSSNGWGQAGLMRIYINLIGSTHFRELQDTVFKDVDPEVNQTLSVN